MNKFTPLSCKAHEQLYCKKQTNKQNADLLLIVINEENFPRQLHTDMTKAKGNRHFQTLKV